MKSLIGLLSLIFTLTFSSALQANPNREFNVDRTSIPALGVVTFDASSIRSSKKLLWTFGDGGALSTTNKIVSYQYKLPGVYTASLSYQVNASEKNPNYKLAGNVQITVKNTAPKPNQAPIASIACSVNNLLVNCSALASYDPENQPLTFTFDYGDGFTESNTTGLSSHAYAVAGLYNVQLSVYDSAGANGSTIIPVQAVKPPNQLPVPVLNCSSTSINTLSCNANGSADSDGIIVSYSYRWDDDQSESRAISDQVTHVFNSSGDHSVTLTVVDNDGGTSTLTRAATVKANTTPVADFNCDTSKPLLLTCTSSSTDPDTGDTIQSFTWKFGENSAFTTSESSADYTFTSAGEIDVILEVKDSFGGTSILTKTFNVKENSPPSFDFIADVISGTTPLTVHFQLSNVQDLDGTIQSINITFGDGSTSHEALVSHTFIEAGTYTVTAEVTDNLGGVTSQEKQIVVSAPVKNPPQAFFKIFEFEKLVELHATITKTQYDIKSAYYTIDGKEIVELGEFLPNTIHWVDMHEYGEHKITLTVEDTQGQTSSFTHNFILTENLDLLKPYTDFTIQQSAAKTVFLNFSRAFDFDADQPIGTFRVDFGNGEVQETAELYLSHTYPTEGTYSIKVTAITTHGTEAATIKEFTVTDVNTPALSPVANFGYRVYDFAQNVSFYNDRSGTPNGTIISYSWNFGDGTTGSGSKVSHFYQPGSYLVTLTVTDSMGKTDSQTERVTIFGTGTDLIAAIDCSLANPFIEITQQCQIIALDRLNQISRVRVTWGDTTASILSLASANGIFKPTHIYNVSGTFPITVTVSTTRGEVKSASTSLNLVNLTASSYPVVNFNCTTNFHTASCSTHGSYDLHQSPITYAIDWGDGEQSVGPMENFEHTFIRSGTFEIKVTAQNEKGLITKISKTLNLTDNQIYPTLNCANNNLLVYCNSLGTYDLAGTTFLYSFDYGDGYVEYNNTGLSSHTYSTSGTFTVKMSVMTGLGEYADAQVTVMPLISQNIMPIAKLACDTSEPFNITCTPEGTMDPDGYISKLIYRFSDGTIIETGSYEPISRSFSTPGITLVELSVFDNEGGETKTISSFEILEQSAFEIECPELALVNDAITPTIILNSQENGAIRNITWNFGNNEKSTELAPIYTYTELGNYIISANVEFESGLTLKRETSVSVYSKPIAKISIDTVKGVAPFLVSLNGSDSIDEYSEIVRMDWFLNNEKIGSGPSLNYTILNAGEMNFALMVTNKMGISSTEVIKVSSSQPPIYIVDDFEKIIAIGEKHSAKVTVSTVPAISPSNLRINILNMPDGFIFDSNTRQIEWTPTELQMGNFEFKITANDGVFYHERTIRIKVIKEKLLLGTQYSENNRSLTMNLPGSALNGAVVKIPEGINLADLKIVTAAIDGLESFDIVSSQEGDFEVEFPSPIKRNIPGSVSHDYLNYAFNPYSAGYKLQSGGGCISSNPASGQIRKGITYSVTTAEDEQTITSFYPAGKYGHVNFYRDSNKITSPKFVKKIITALTGDPNWLINFDIKYNIFFITDTNSPDAGLSVRNIIDTTFIYLPEKTQEFESLIKDIKLTILHEYYHSKQYRIFHCKLPFGEYAPAYKSIMEGSANQQAFKKMGRDKAYSLSFWTPNDPFDTAAMISRDGILGETNYRKNGYYSFLTWDFFNSDNFLNSYYNKNSSNAELKWLMLNDENLNYAKETMARKSFVDIQQEQGVSISNNLDWILKIFYLENNQQDNSKLYNHIITSNSDWESSLENLYARSILNGTIDWYIQTDSQAFFPFEIKPLSAERKMITLQNAIGDFSTNEYPFYIKVQKENPLIFSTAPMNAFIKLDPGTNLSRKPDESITTTLDSIGIVKFEEGGSNLTKNTFPLNIINPTNEFFSSSLVVKSSCKTFLNQPFTWRKIEGYEENGSPQFSYILNPIRISCGNRDCRVKVSICAKDFDTKTDNAFTNTTKCPARYYKQWSQTTNQNMEGDKVAAPSEYWYSIGIIYTANPEDFFGPYPHTDTWNENKVIICQIGGEESVDFLKVEKD